MDRATFFKMYDGIVPNRQEQGKTLSYWTFQHPEEIFWLVENVARIGAKNILEIGSSHGGTLYIWDQIAAPGGKVVSVDLQELPHGSGHGITMDFTAARSNLIFLKGSSRDQLTLETVKDFFPEGIDFLFIDGDHSYAGAKHDYQWYSPLVRPGGLVAFHDICYDTEIQVGRVFREIDVPAHRKLTKEITHGIGIVVME